MTANTADYAFLMGVRYQQHPRCFTCDADGDVRLVTVRDPKHNRFLMRGYICADHAALHMTKGHEIWQNGSKLEDF
jgi:hypothetical protein